MTTLNKIIASINQQLAAAEQISTDTTQGHRSTDEVEQKQKYVLVHVAHNAIAIPIDGLAEIGPVPPITTLPNLPAWVLGIVNLRGEIVSVIDLSTLFSISPEQKIRGDRLAVLQDERMKIGFCVERVIGTVARSASERETGSGSRLEHLAPEVFPERLLVEGTGYLILNPSNFLKMDRLFNV